MAANSSYLARSVLNNVFMKSRSNSPCLVSVFDERKKITSCSRCLCSHDNTNSRYNGVKRGLDKPPKRKLLRKIKGEVYTRNNLDPNMERAARSRKLLVPLDDVRSGWIPKRYPHQVMTMASYYGIYEHMFDGLKFMPQVVMDIDFSDKVGVHYGNFIEPIKTSCEPQVKYDGSENSLTTLLMVNLDGNILSENHEILHWMVGNIPNGDVKEGEVVSGYLPPCPVKGTGFHRFVFCLFNQNARCNFEEIYRTHCSRNLVSRSFKTALFLKMFQGQLDPVSLSFFQATWDTTVTNTFTEILGAKEPVYDLEPFLTPNQKKKLKVQDIFQKKYTNM